MYPTSMFSPQSLQNHCTVSTSTGKTLDNMSSSSSYITRPHTSTQYIDPWSTPPTHKGTTTPPPRPPSDLRHKLTSPSSTASTSYADSIESDLSSIPDQITIYNFLIAPEPDTYDKNQLFHVHKDLRSCFQMVPDFPDPLVRLSASAIGYFMTELLKLNLHHFTSMDCPDVFFVYHHPLATILGRNIFHLQNVPNMLRKLISVHDRPWAQIPHFLIKEIFQSKRQRIIATRQKIPANNACATLAITQIHSQKFFSQNLPSNTPQQEGATSSSPPITKPVILPIRPSILRTKKKTTKNSPPSRRELLQKHLDKPIVTSAPCTRCRVKQSYVLNTTNYFRLLMCISCSKMIQIPYVPIPEG